LLKGFQPFGLIDTQPALLLFPPIVGLFGDADLPASLNDGNPFASFQLYGAEMLDDCFGRVRFAGHGMTSWVGGPD